MQTHEFPGKLVLSPIASQIAEVELDPLIEDP
jgi:hypothetical protein